MEQHTNYWQQFAKSGNPMMYLAYKQNRTENSNANNTLHLPAETTPQLPV